MDKKVDRPDKDSGTLKDFVRDLEIHQGHKEDISNIYEAKTQDEFVTFSKKYYFWATHSRFEPIKKAAKSIRRGTGTA